MAIKRDSMQVQSEINLTKANIEQVQRGDHYSEKDKEILIPHYRKHLWKLENELHEITVKYEVVARKL